MPARPRPTPAPASLASLVTGLLATLLACLLVAGLAAPAEAATRRTVSDAQRDVLRQSGQRDPVPAPDNRAADVTRTTVVMTPNKLVLQTFVRRLPPRFWAMLWRIRTDTGAELSLDLTRTDQTRLVLSQGDVDVACDGTARDIDARRNRVTVAVPLTCLGSPTAVRVGAGAAATSRDFSRIWVDDAQRTRGFRDDRLALGRTVRRG